MKETVVRFGPNKGLMGILTEPADCLAGGPVAVILNAGMTHRVGPFRLHVHLARRLAGQGFRVFRLDLSGRGDSQIRAGKLSHEERAQLDVQDAFDCLAEKLGVGKFVLIGLCSGAFNSHQVSVNDERVVGAVFMDGIVFRTIGYYLRSSMRYVRPRFWRNAIKRRVGRKSAPTKTQQEAKEMAEGFFFGDGLDRESTRRDLESLVQRGVRMLFLYTDGYDDICGRAQFREMYGLEPDSDLLQLEYYEKSEHTYRLTNNRSVAIDRIATWFEGFGAAESQSA